MVNKAKLLELREKIGEIDSALIQILAQRFKTVQQVAELKKLQGWAIRDETREKAHKDHMQQLSKAKGLDIQMIGEIFELIMQYSVKAQEKYINHSH